MAEYISKEAVIKKIAEVQDKATTGTEDVAYYRAIKIIRDEPVADVQPIKHGYWEEITDYGGWGDTHYRCSVCGEEWYLEDGTPKDNNMNGCPRCLAKMDAEPDEPWQSE